jgi:hypothetical protein
MQLIINEQFENNFKKRDVENLIKLLKNKTPDFHRKKERRKIWQIEHNNYNIFVKNFNYPNLMLKKIKSYGLKNYKVAKFLLKNNIKTPVPVFFYSNGNDEFFSTIAINNCIDLWEYLSTKPDVAIQKNILTQLKNLVDKFAFLNIYHSDFNIRNLILDKNKMELYILDLEAVRFNFNKRRKEKMVKKINKYLSAFNLSI